jgi:hypothetical protein
MPLQKLQFRPGVNREGTTLANEGGWFECDKVRFRSGYPEKIGGWAAVSFFRFLGVCRSLWNWITLRNYNLLGVGTNLKFYINDIGGAYYDVTPIRITTGPGTVAGGTVTFAAAYTTLTNNINATQTSIVINSATNVPLNGGLIKIGSEEISYTVRSGTTLSGCTRGANGTTAASALAGDPVAFSSIIVTNATGSGFDTNDFVTFSLATSLGGNITAAVLNQEYQITAESATTFSVNVRAVSDVGTPGAAVFSTAADVGNGGASTRAAYQISSGNDIYTVGTGWGAGPWSRGGWGSGYTSGIGQQLRLWSQANFGENLLFNPRGGALYVWLPGGGTTPAFGTRAVQVSTANECPSLVNTMLVSDVARIVLAFGCNDYSISPTPNVLDPMLIRWSAQESYTDWVFYPDGTTQAGFNRLSHGSLIVGAIQTRQEILVWTDVALYAMQYVGPPLVWSFTYLADNISIAGPNAMATANGVTYWMGTDKFYVYSGRVETLPCALRQYVFSDINRQQAFQFFASTNEGFSEVWWFYCSANSSIIDRYVIFNYLDKVWYYGTMGRTAWLDSGLRPYPQAATLNNLIVYHEAAVDDGTTNPPSPISAYIQSADFDIGDGHNYGFVWQIVPDVTFDGSNTTGTTLKPSVTFTVRPRQNPGSPYGSSDTPSVTTTQSYVNTTSYNVQEFTQLVNTRIRGRQMAFKISSNTLGTQWQLGTPRINVRPDGRR